MTHRPIPAAAATRRSPLRAGFSLVELVVVMLIMSTLAGLAVPLVGNRLRAARDARRMTDLRTVQEAIEQYKLDKGAYPAASQNAGYGGWDVSHDGDFIPVLVAEGYLASTVVDPLNDSTYHFRYYLYPRGYASCVGAESFYVLGIRNFEDADSSSDYVGAFACSGRDWGSEFDFVTGGGASYQ